jgi:hypothetical protein
MRIAALGLLLLYVCGANSADDKRPQPASRVDRLKKIEKDVVQKVRDLEKKLLLNKPPPSQQIAALFDFYETRLTLREQYAGKALDLAKEKPDDAVGYDALRYAFLESRPESAVRREAQELICGHHLANPKIEGVLPNLCLKGKEYDRKLIDKIVDTNPAQTVKALAMLTRGLATEREVMTAKTKDAEIYPKLKEATLEFEQAASRYGKLTVNGMLRGRVADIARREIDTLQNTPIGKPAPALSAVDFNGIQFNLADHKGQVVLLYVYMSTDLC